MKYGPGISAEQVHVPEVVVPPQDVYYTTNPTPSSYPSSSATYPPITYPYNPNFLQTTSYGLK